MQKYPEKYQADTAITLEVPCQSCYLCQTFSQSPESQHACDNRSWWRTKFKETPEKTQLAIPGEILEIIFKHEMLTEGKSPICNI